MKFHNSFPPIFQIQFEQILLGRFLQTPAVRLTHIVYRYKKRISIKIYILHTYACILMQKEISAMKRQEYRPSLDRERSASVWSANLLVGIVRIGIGGSAQKRPFLIGGRYL
jgi:cytochrome b subunit of formate dehydrogenase